MNSLDDFAETKLAELDAKSLRRRLVTVARSAGAHAAKDGAELISFCCNDYLNLSQHPEVKQAAADAALAYGAGAGASRLVTGNHPLYEALEAKLARLKGTEAAVVFGSGYLANMGIVPSLAGPGDLILIDELAHACLFAGARLARSSVVIYPHSDVGALRRLLRERRAAHERAVILTDGVFSMDGDGAPLATLSEAAAEHDAWLMTDDAHGLGVLGEGRGSLAEARARARRFIDVPLQMGTLSKAVGSYGGYLCASRAVVDLIRTRARTFIYTTGLPPAVVAASIAALDIIERDTDLCERPMRQARAFACALGLPAPQSPVVPLILGDADTTLKASALLEAHGFLVTAIRPPTVPEGTARLRLTFCATHRDEDVARLAHAVAREILPRAVA